MIEITGLKLIDVLRALHENTNVPPTGVCMMQHCAAHKEENVGTMGGWTISDEQYQEVLDHCDGFPYYFDYLFGKPLKVEFKEQKGKVFITCGDLYDRDHPQGKGACEYVIEQLKLRQ